MHVFVRFTGTRPGSLWYQARGTNRYAFGQNESHYQQAIPVAEWPALKAEFGAWLLEVPVEKARRSMVLHTLVASCDLPVLTRQVKTALIDAGLETLGMVLAEDGERLLAILGDKSAIVMQAIGERVGLYDAPAPIAEAPGAPMVIAEAIMPAEAKLPVVAAPIESERATMDAAPALVAVVNEKPGPPPRRLKRKR